MLIAAISTLLLLIVLNKVFDLINKQRELKMAERRDFLEVLKVITKHECFGRFSDDPTNFENWVGNFLKLKGYKDIVVTPPENDGGKDLIVTDRFGQKVYVECKLWNPSNWEINVGRPVAQKLVGAMIGDGVKNGFMITTANLTNEAKEYIKQVNARGYKIEFLEGDALMDELYNLRDVKLKGLLEAF